VQITDGEIEVLSPPKVNTCPLRRSLYGLEEETSEGVENVLREHMKELGMYGPKRILELHQKPVSFGASELIFDAMAEGLVDAAVLVCEGAGTTVITRPEVVQAVGAHMTGLISTEPIEEIQTGLKERGCLLVDKKATIDQAKGYQMALDAGFENIVVSLTGFRAADCKRLRDMEKSSGTILALFAVHNTGINREQAFLLAENCDLVWSCASKWVREVVGGRSLLQMGISIPVYALTKLGKRLILNRAYHFEESLVLHRATLPHVPSEKQPFPLI